MSLKLLPVLVIALAALEVAPLSNARVFLTARNYPCGELPVAATVNDFNNDGTANRNDKDLSVLLGTGFSVGSQAVDEFILQDLNGDGQPDLAATNLEDAVAVILNTERHKSAPF